MYSILFMLNLLMSSIFLFMKHPMSMGFILMIQTLIISLILGFMSYSFWFSYILFLIMIGGMLILFIYMTSIASNELFNLSKNIIIFLVNLTILITIIFLLIDPYMLNLILKNIFNYEITNSLNSQMNENSMPLSMIFNKPNYLITFMLINYLLLTLIAIVKITNFNSGPLRQKF